MHQKKPSFMSAILHSAVAFGAIMIVEYCLDCGATVDDDAIIRSVVASRRTPLAVRSDAVYRLLVDRNAVDVNYEMERFGAMIALAATRNRRDLVRWLLKRGASPGEQVESEGPISALASAAQYSDTEMVAILLDGGGKLKDVNELGINTWDERSHLHAGCALHKCVERGYSELIDTLLQAGADTGLNDGQGRNCGRYRSAEKPRRHNCCQIDAFSVKTYLVD